MAATPDTLTTDTALEALLADALVYRTRTGTAALSLDGGATLHDPRGRKVPAAHAWAEADEDPEDVWDDLTDDQRQAAMAAADRLASACLAPIQAAADARALLLALLDGGGTHVGLTDGATALQRAVGGRRFYRMPGAQLCVGFVKRGGYRTHLAPVTLDQAVGVATGELKVVYWTNSNRYDVVPA